MLPDSNKDISQTYLEAIEDELQRAVKRVNNFGMNNLYGMLAYHMGWDSITNHNETRGKRIRPLLVLLSCSAAGGNWVSALPGATAVELVHNFSLIHDDIEDHSPLRRGRPTIWKKWGIPQAINTGDAMYSLAHLEAVRLAETVSPSIGLQAVDILQSTCLHLTQGQYLDLLYEKRKDITIEDYWKMVEGKTAALVAVSAELGAMAAFSDENKTALYRKFGWSLGLAFQVQDDILGIWGNTLMTGKSSQSDLVTGKITLPVLYGLSQKRHFARRWTQGSIHPKELPEVIQYLETEGGKEFAQSQENQLINHALTTLDEAKPIGIAAEALRNLALSLVNRRI
ncbi:MAG: polyprenyl synthetase family protein [Anaerolineales bacterium]